MLAINDRAPFERVGRVLLVFAFMVLSAGVLCTRASADSGMVNVTATVAPIAGGGSSSTYALPDGETMVVATPPANFAPSLASDAELAEYGFPARPAGGSALAEWQQAMTIYTPAAPPPATITVPTDTAQNASTYDDIWAGFTAGQWNTQSPAFDAVQADVTVPTADGCFGSGQVLFAWIGLGGTTNSGYDLVQEGVECDDYGPGSNLPATGAMHPFREWAGTYAPQDLCGIPKNVYGGETMYDSISYDTINGKAYFYMENVGAGTGSGQLIGKCWVDKPKPPANWHFDGNTADYEVEVATKKQQPLSFNVSPISFSGADLQWTSDSDRWVPFGSRPTTKTYDGVQNSDGSLGPYCEGPSKIGSDQESFTVTESDGACHQNWTTAGS